MAKALDIPVCANTQQDVRAKKGWLGSINFARAITHESDVVMTLERDEEMIEDNEAKITLNKQREGTLGSVMLNWDFSTMNFGGIYCSNSDREDITEDDIDENILGID